MFHTYKVGVSRLLLLVAATSITAARWAMADVTAGEIRGSVFTVDSKGGRSVVPGAKVSLKGSYWQEKTQWHTCVAYLNPTAEYAAKIQTGSHVFIEGEPRLPRV